MVRCYDAAERRTRAVPRRQVWSEGHVEIIDQPFLSRNPIFDLLAVGELCCVFLGLCFVVSLWVCALLTSFFLADVPR